MITIIVPTLNESENISRFFEKIAKVKFKYELIFVDDNSSDNTRSEIKKIKKNNVKLILRKNKNRDLAKSVFLGIEKSVYENILVLDCDLQHDIKSANLMQKVFFQNKLDLVVGSRFLKKKISGNLGFFRSISSLCFIFIINILFKKKTTDPLSGFFICKKKIILKNKKNYFLNGYKILFDILYNSNKDLKKADIQINFGKRIVGSSKLNIKIVVIFIKQLFYTFLR
jgi:dolichol-phosphate mannosyltransferase